MNLPTASLDKQSGNAAAHVAGNGLTDGERVLFLGVDGDDLGLLL